MGCASGIIQKFGKMADRLAKEIIRMQQSVGAITYQQKKNYSCLQTVPNISARRIPSPGQRSTSYHLPFNNGLKVHMFSSFKIGDSAKCTCGQGPQTAEHVLQDWRQYIMH
jgi:hypothetical protein